MNRIVVLSTIVSLASISLTNIAEGRQIIQCPDKGHGPVFPAYTKPTATNLIVFVHGLCGDSISTWQHDDGTALFDFPMRISEDFNDSDVMSFDYSSSLRSSPRIGTVAKQLGDAVQMAETKHAHRTIQFVAHSMGGLVVREFIIHRVLMAAKPPTFYVTTLVELATPNTGSHIADFASYFDNARQVAELRSENNSWLDDLNDDWSMQFVSKDGNARPFRLYAGWEGLRMCLDVGFFSNACVYIVDEPSAIYFSDGNERFEKNHLTIAKPIDKGDHVYEWVSQMLKQGNDKVLAEIKRQSVESPNIQIQKAFEPAGSPGNRGPSSSSNAMPAKPGE
jgi:pimeloyl-ACP methyl ester carboxylesterase